MNDDFNQDDNVNLNNDNQESFNSSLSDIRNGVIKARNTINNNFTPKKKNLSLDEKNKVSPKNNNNIGKNLLNNSNNIKKPNTSKLDNDKLKNANGVKDKLAKNGVRKAAKAFAPGLATKAAIAAANKANELKNKKNEKNNKDNNKSRNSNNNNLKDNSISNSNKLDIRNSIANFLEINVNDKKSKILLFFIKNFPMFFPIFLSIICLFFIVIVFSSLYDYNDKNFNGSGSSNGSGTSSCNDISLTSTTLSRDEFIGLVNTYANGGKASLQLFASKAGSIYDISVQNKFNPEMVVIRAVVEGLSPGGATNNYWGLGCSNTGGGRDCTHYSSFDQGVLGYIKNIQDHGYTSALEMMKKYAYIGHYWYNPGSSSKGGCYYFPYVKKYLSDERALLVEPYCSVGRTCTDSSCFPTNDEDQTAYANYQLESMKSRRTEIFGINEQCNENSNFSTNLESRSDIANYAKEIFDDFGYSQANRMSNSYVDCSSLVYRTYMHFNIDLSYKGDTTTSGLLQWCDTNKKLIRESDLAPGDLIFFNHGSYSQQNHYKNVGHVEIYYGGGQTFGAHSDKYPHDKQVSVVNYNNDGDFFCRP